MGQSRAGRAIGGALSGAGGLLSQLATRRMAEAQAQKLQDQQIQEARHKADLGNLERGYSFRQLKLGHEGLDPGLTDSQKGSFGFDAITNNGQTIPTVGQAESEARTRFPNRMNDVPAVGPPGSLQQDVQTILGAREGMALNKPNTVRSVGMQDFPVPVPGGGPPDEFDSLLSSRMFDALNKPVGPAFPSERTAEQQALRDEIVGRGGARGAGFGAAEASGSPEGLAATQAEAHARSFGTSLGSFAADLSEMGRAALWEKSQRDLQQTISASRATYNFDIERSGLSGQQQTAALGLADDFYRESGEFFGIDASFRRMSTLAANPSAVGDIGMVFSVMKMYDPTSTVREGEQAQARNTATIPEAMWQTYNRLFIDGESLTVDQRAEFDRVGRDIHETARLLHEDRVTAFNERATAVGVPDHVREKLFRGDTPLSTQEEMRNPHTWAQMVNDDVSLLDTATAYMDEEEKIAFRAALEELGITVEVQ